MWFDQWDAPKLPAWRSLLLLPLTRWRFQVQCLDQGYGGKFMGEWGRRTGKWRGVYGISLLYFDWELWEVDRVLIKKMKRVLGGLG